MVTACQGKDERATDQPPWLPEEGCRRPLAWPWGCSSKPETCMSDWTASGEHRVLDEEPTHTRFLCLCVELRENTFILNVCLLECSFQAGMS